MLIRNNCRLDHFYSPRMIFNGVLCTISVIVSNLSCLALSSFFNSILSSKRNILTQLNTVLVFVMTAVVDTLVRLEKEIQSFYENAIFLNMTYFPVWQHSDLSNICTPNPSGDDSPARFILALVAISRRSCSSQSHKDFPDTQGKYKSMKRNPTNECIQPTEFTQLDHERRFQQIFFGLLTSTTIYSLAILTINNLVAEGQD